ncbi:MAG TPA: hypothetical protein VFR07_15680 [Mycobacteriales bacterium]|jgi:type IV secretory pathway TrbD component|nr:hypothetical protein [Mycobacteriales bacterium]
MDDSRVEGTPDPALLDVGALRRRVLLAAVVTFVLFLTAAYVLTALEASSLWLVLVVALLWVLVVRPMMRPVREATALRRRLAYRAYLAQRDQDGAGAGSGP